MTPQPRIRHSSTTTDKTTAYNHKTTRILSPHSRICLKIERAIMAQLTWNATAYVRTMQTADSLLFDLGVNEEHGGFLSGIRRKVTARHFVSALISRRISRLLKLAQQLLDVAGTPHQPNFLKIMHNRHKTHQHGANRKKRQNTINGKNIQLRALTVHRDNASCLLFFGNLRQFAASIPSASSV